RHWMAQALRAPRDPAWVADGFVSDKWLPLSPITGRLDAFEWKAPFGQIEGPLEEGAAVSVDAALKSLPPMREATPATAAVKATSPIVASPTTRTSVIELEPIAAKPATAAAATEPAKEPEPRPFFGGAPDDPGVKNRELEPDPKTRLKLF
ncbi:hypothetical protein PMI03_02578, partial [Rhizobium sp. AP16]